MPMTEDLSVFLNTAEFASAATYDGSTAIDVIFDRAYLAGLGIAGTDPQALCDSSDVADNPRGKLLVIAGVTYTIQNRRAIDDGAFSVLELSLAS